MLRVTTNHCQVVAECALLFPTIKQACFADKSSTICIAKQYVIFPEPKILFVGNAFRNTPNQRKINISIYSDIVHTKMSHPAFNVLFPASKTAANFRRNSFIAERNNIPIIHSPFPPASNSCISPISPRIRSSLAATEARISSGSACSTVSASIRPSPDRVMV